MTELIDSIGETQLWTLGRYELVSLVRYISRPASPDDQKLLRLVNLIAFSTNKEGAWGACNQVADSKDIHRVHGDRHLLLGSLLLSH